MAKKKAVKIQHHYHNVKTVLLDKISWDTDGEKVKLPKKVLITLPDDFDIQSGGADILSDIYGFCVNGFLFKE